MVANTAIEWAHHTFNPWIGCQHVSPACDHCYAEQLSRARLGVAWGAGAERRRTKPGTWALPRRWDREAAEKGIRYRVFCASLADVFDNAVDPLWRTDLAELIEATPNLDWLLLTKRIGNAEPMMRRHMLWTTAPANVWIGATVVSQAEADRDVPKLLATPASKRFLSMEPLLGPVDLTRVCIVPRVPGSPRAGIHVDTLRGRYVESGLPYVGEWDVTGPYPDGAPALSLDWIIAGGESGPDARPMHPDWARSLRDQCAAAGVPFLFKQWGDWLPWAPACPPEWEGQNGQREDHHVLLPDDIDADPRWDDGLWAIPEHEHFVFQRVGKRSAGRLLDGSQHDGVPA